MATPQEAATIVIQEILRPYSELVKRLFRPAFDEVGGGLGDVLRQVRMGVLVKFLPRTQQLLRAAGIEPSQVRLKVLVPILDGATLEEDEQLQPRWPAT